MIEEPELNSEQWRAIASVYHLYVTGTGGDSRESLAHQKDGNDAVEWVKGVLPSLKRAFPQKFLDRMRERWKAEARTSAKRNGANESRRKGETRSERASADRRRGELWRQELPHYIDSFLSDLFHQDTLISLTRREQVLLCLLNKEQQMLEKCSQRHKVLKEVVHHMGVKLINLAESEANGDAGSLPETRGSTSHEKELSDWDHDPCLDVMESDEFLTRRKVGTAVSKGGKARNIGAVPVEKGTAPVVVTDIRSSSSSSNADSADGTPCVRKPNHAQGIADPIEFICVECNEPGGDLFRCHHCHSLRHERCGGPRIGSEYCFCKKCYRHFGFNSSSTSLRSSTSTDERLQLNECDDDTSLSGFIVLTSDEDEENEDKRNSPKRKRLDRSSSSSQEVQVVEFEEPPSRKGRQGQRKRMRER
uniref:WGS project CAEQ00000000 data, annotated contig 397 n=1 Tax=Trypanosoma congolense (strain IL3000) TaxID=1068625 RepID=F9WFK8_TRYCI|nr:unnamed protein product [Trypanosoma congolense IL3000]